MKRIYFALFTLSGFSGLIYESIWSHYLKLFLGHAAYAQTLVLAIFMGGMALGSWLCAKYSARWKNLLLAYALAEGLIGIAALAFHNVFDGFLQLAYFTLIPALGSPGTVVLFKWSTAALLILPQSILLGMTFPLMSAGIIRRFPEAPGGTVAMLYFTNSIGAAVGVLVSGFVLIAAVGLPGTIRVAGVINVALALLVWMLARRASEPAFAVPAQTQSNWASPHWYRLFLGIALLTGAASFIYEIAWIRMLSLVLGSSTHAFELMLSAFILGLALGGLWIKRVIDRVADPVRYLAGVQVVMGVLALATLPLYDSSFDVMRWIMNAVPRTETGYLWFNLSSHAIAAVIMLPATICAGMTLPLITFTLMKQGHGEKSIGTVYAANTVGAIAGVFFATHVGMSLLGLKHLLTLGAAVDIALGLALAWRFIAPVQKRWAQVATGVGAGALAFTVAAVELSPHKMASGVYRYGRLQDPSVVEILFHQDGKTASIDVLGDRERKNVTVSTNGKPDASINMAGVGAASPDEVTMILAGALPLAMHPRATTAAVIGFGSGLTTHTLAMAPTLTTVDTVEIEAAMVQGAQQFRPRVNLAYSAPNSHIYIDDAKTFFSTHGKKYDIIASEPSNPWVSGVSGLFTEEFYRLVKHFLNDDGLLVQWIQMYEIDVELIASVVKALSIHFPNYVIYASNDDDMLLIAGDRADLSPNARLFAIPGMAEELNKHGIRHMQDLELHRIGDRRSLQPLFESYAIAKNSDYYPVLDTRAAQTRFMNRGATELVKLIRAGVPLTRLLAQPAPSAAPSQYTPNPYLTASDPAFAATLLHEFALTGRMAEQYDKVPNDLKFYAENLRAGLITCEAELDPTSWLVSVVGVAQATQPYLTPAELQRLWTAARDAPCYATAGSTKQNWIQLMLALATADGPNLERLARQLLDDAERDSPAIAKFLLHAATAGAVLQDRRDAARDAWTRYAAAAYPDGQYDLTARVLMAHANVKY
jgi:predicted membrane-bound spermidine synthase